MLPDIYYEIASLPSIPELGAEPPIRPARFIEHLSPDPAAYKMVKAIFLANDLLLRESIISGQPKDITPIILSKNAIIGEEPLPDYLIPTEEDRSYIIEADRIWDRYFRYVKQLSQEVRSDFLLSWVKFEVTLRNALAYNRAQKLNIEPEPYLVATDLVDEDLDLTNAISEWSNAQTPLEAQKTIIKTKWNWVNENDHWFTFKIDELGVYGVKLSLLDYWIRIT